MSAKDFHDSRQNASGEAATTGETSSEVDLNVGTSSSASAPKPSSVRPTEGAVRNNDGYREVYRKAGGWAGEREEHPNDGENRVHLNNFSRKVSELSPQEIKTAASQASEYSKGMSEAIRAVKSAGATGAVVDADLLGRDSRQRTSTTDGTPGKSKVNMEFDPLKGRMVRVRPAGTEQPKDQSYFDRISSRHPNPGVSAGAGIPAYDRHPQDIQVLYNL